MRRIAARLSSLAALVLGLALAVAPASADEAKKPGDRWLFEITPYFWAAGISGDIQVPSRLHPSGSINVDVDIDIGDILSNLASVPFMGMIEVRHDRFALIGDLIYLAMETGAETPRQGFGRADLRLDTTIGTVVGTYRAIDVPSQSLEFGGGIRIWSVTTELSLSPGLLPGGRVERTSTWVDPVLAARYRARLADRFFLTLYGDIGGFGVESDITWQAVASFDFAATPWLDLKLGYRYLAVEVSKDRLDIDLGFHGPFLAATFRF